MQIYRGRQPHREQRAIGLHTIIETTNTISCTVRTYITCKFVSACVRALVPLDKKTPFDEVCCAPFHASPIPAAAAILHLQPFPFTASFPLPRHPLTNGVGTKVTKRMEKHCGTLFQNNIQSSTHCRCPRLNRTRTQQPTQTIAALSVAKSSAVRYPKISDKI